jgi:hypothetical protein
MSKRAGDPGYAAGWCIHYRYNRDEKITTCEAGVDYTTLPKLFSIRPCFLTEAGESKPGAATCSKLRRPTPEEIKTHEVWLKERHKVLFKAMALCLEHAEGRRGVAGSIFCPACTTGVLRYSVSSYNGHIHGQCDTPNCLSWMQ